MITIFKYNIGEQLVRLPKNAWILSAGIQDAQFFIWAKVDTDIQETELFRFKVYGTGWNMTYAENRKECFLATIFEGNHVWHIFYSKEI